MFDVAWAGIRVATGASAVLQGKIHTIGIPIGGAAGWVECTDRFATCFIVAEWIRAHFKARAIGGVAARETALQGALRAHAIPVGVAAEGVVVADQFAAGLVFATDEFAWLVAVSSIGASACGA